MHGIAREKSSRSFGPNRRLLSKHQVNVQFCVKLILLSSFKVTKVADPRNRRR